VANVFLSYSKQDSDVAGQIILGLRHGGIVASPAHLPEQPPGVKAVSRELTSAKCVIVLWSEHSVQDKLVRAEADYARTRGIVVSAVIGSPELPPTFREVRSANLTHWSGEPGAEAFAVLKRLVEARVSSTPRPNRPREMPSVFVCYRREDTQDAAGRLHDRLVDAYGSERVFMDIDSVPLGIDFVAHIAEQIGRCSAVIVMIGKQWHTIKDKKRRRRLDNEDDLVRAEIRAALQQNVPVIPVMVQNAAMPDAEALPSDIRPLTRRNGIELAAARWRTDVEKLITELDRVMKG
jgi:hypothetical protein